MLTFLSRITKYAFIPSVKNFSNSSFPSDKEFSWIMRKAEISIIAFLFIAATKKFSF